MEYVIALLKPDTPDVLSHVSVRARNNKVYNKVYNLLYYNYRCQITYCNEIITNA